MSIPPGFYLYADELVSDLFITAMHEASDKIAGRIHVDLRRRRGQPWGRPAVPIVNVAHIKVEPAFQRRGVATALYHAAAQAVAARGYHLASDLSLEPGSRGFWKKQVRKGRARRVSKLTGYGSKRRHYRYVLDPALPRSLLNPPGDAGRREAERRMAAGDPQGKADYLKARHRAGELERSSAPMFLRWQGAAFPILKSLDFPEEQPPGLEGFIASNEYEYVAGGTESASRIRALERELGLGPAAIHLTAQRPEHPDPEITQARDFREDVRSLRGGEFDHAVDLQGEDDAADILETSALVWAAVLATETRFAAEAERATRTKKWRLAPGEEHMAAAIYERANRGERMSAAELPYAVWSWLLDHEMDYDSAIYSQQAWTDRGEEYGVGEGGSTPASMVLATEGSFYEVLNYGNNHRILDEWVNWTAAIGWDAQPLHSWSLGFWPEYRQNPDEVLRELERQAAAGDLEAADELKRRQRRIRGSGQQRALFAARNALKALEPGGGSMEALGELLRAAAQLHTQSGVEQVMLSSDTTLSAHYPPAIGGPLLDAVYDQEAFAAVQAAVAGHRFNGSSYSVRANRIGMSPQILADIYFSADDPSDIETAVYELESRFNSVDERLAWKHSPNTVDAIDEEWDIEIAGDDEENGELDVWIHMERPLALYHLLLLIPDSPEVLPDPPPREPDPTLYPGTKKKRPRRKKKKKKKKRSSR